MYAHHILSQDQFLLQENTPFQLSMFERAGDLANPMKVTHGDERAHNKPFIHKLRRESGGGAAPTSIPANGEYTTDQYGYQPGADSDFNAPKANEAMWASKLKTTREATMGDGRSLYDHMAEGIRKPVDLVSPTRRIVSNTNPDTQVSVGYKPHLVDGHHRVAVANDVNPDQLVPVSWDNPSNRTVTPRSQGA